MALPRRETTSATTRPVDLSGDSPEIIAFALLRYLAQIEQQLTGSNRPVFDRTWMLDAYAECLEAVRGERKPKGARPRRDAKSRPDLS